MPARRRQQQRCWERIWTDWTIYWAVDFDFEIKREIIRVRKELTPDEQARLPTMEPEQRKLMGWEEQWTGDYIFGNDTMTIVDVNIGWGNGRGD